MRPVRRSRATSGVLRKSRLGHDDADVQAPPAGARTPDLYGELDAHALHPELETASRALCWASSSSSRIRPITAARPAVSVPS